MAGDWIKVEHVTPWKSEVLAIATDLGICRREAFAACVELWIWADQNLLESNACVTLGVTLDALDSVVGIPGFGQAMLDKGWLNRDSEGCLTFPNADRHILQTAKTRALTAKRAVKFRSKTASKKRNASVTQPALPTTTEEKKKNTPPCPPSSGGECEVDPVAGFREEPDKKARRQRKASDG